MNSEARNAQHLSQSPISQPALTLVIYALIGCALAFLMRDIRFDDPYITYRYAEHLALGNGFVFNPGEHVLITTAPLYALILAVARMAGADIPGASFVIGVISLIAAAFALFLLGRQDRHTRAGFVAGLFLLLFPLVWLTVGFETPLFLAVALLTFLAARARRSVLAGIGAGVAIGLRGDGFIVFVVVVLSMLEIGDWRLEIKHGRPVVQSPISNLESLGFHLRSLILAALAVYAPLAIWLTMQYGSPLPTTLQTKSAQAVSGLTGFYPFTTYLEGVWLVGQALLAQSVGLVVMLLAVLAGVVYGLRARAYLGGLLMTVVWACLHLIGYGILGVAPYVWYYAPAVPGLVTLAALGIEWANRRVDRRWLAATLSGWVVLCLVAADAPIVTILQGAIPPSPSDLRAKLLPETKVDIYTQVGLWLRDHTPAQATVGVTELGVMSYYAQRHVVDFLGLTQPQHLAAIRHGDYLQTLLREQPDYVALTGLNAVYDFDPQRAAWFTALYTPVVSFEDARFWGSPMTVWQRSGAPISTSVTLDSASHDLDEGGDDLAGWQITAIEASSRSIHAGQPLLLRLRVRAGKALGTRTLRVQPVVIEGGDGLPVSSRLIYTNQWRPGEEAWVDVPIMPQPAPRKGGYVVEAGWLDGGPVVRAGTLKVSLDEPARPGVSLAPLSQGVSVEVQAQPMTLCVGTTQPITIYWRGGAAMNADYTAFVQLRNDATVVAQADAPPRNGSYPTTVWSPGEVIPDPHMLTIGADVALGPYALVVGLYNPIDDTRWPVDSSPYRTPDGGVHVADVVVRECLSVVGQADSLPH